jgi:hypothetical protein
MEDIKNSQCEKLFGEIDTVEFVDYYKYVFSLKATTTKGYTVEFDTGGDSDDIYRYSPLNRSWKNQYNSYFHIRKIFLDGNELSELEIQRMLKNNKQHKIKFPTYHLIEP